MSELKEVQIYGEFEAGMAELEDSCNFIADVSTDEGYNKSKRVALDAGKIITAIEKKRVAEKADSIAYGKQVDAEAKDIKARIEVFQLPHKDAYKELDNLKKEREANRKAALEERVRVIRELPEAMADSDSDGVKMALESLQVEECLDFYELTAEALTARNASKDALSKMFADKLKQEKDAIELAELRKKQAEQDQKDRDERIAKEASEKAEQVAKDAREAEQKAIDQATQAVKDQKEAEQKAKAADIQARHDAVIAAAKAQVDIDEAAKAATEEAERLQKAKEAAEKADQERREANTRHISKIRKEAKDCLIALGVDEKLAKKIILAIHNNAIKNISINY